MHLSRGQRISSAVSSMMGPSTPAPTTIMASIGKSRNRQRDFTRRVVHKLSSYVEPTMIKVPFKNHRTQQASLKLWPVSPPHLIMHMLHQHDLIETIIVAGIDLAQLWASVGLESPEHPAVALAYAGEPPLPLRIHGDEGTILRQAGLLVLNMCGFLHAGLATQSRLVNAVFPTRNYFFTKKQKKSTAQSQSSCSAQIRCLELQPFSCWGLAV